MFWRPRSCHSHAHHTRAASLPPLHCAPTAGWLSLFGRSFQQLVGLHPRLEALLHKLLDAGAEPLLPPNNPAISLCGRDLAGKQRPRAFSSACSMLSCLSKTSTDRLLSFAGAMADYMVQAHAAGRRQLSREHAVALLQLCLRHNHRDPYPQLLAMLRQEEAAEPLPPLLALQLLAAAARWGDEAAVTDALALVPQGGLAAPQAAPACLLAHTVLRDRPGRLWGGRPDHHQQTASIMRRLLDAGAALHINDVCRTVQEAQPSALRCLLRIGQPRVSQRHGAGAGWAGCTA